MDLNINNDSFFLHSNPSLSITLTGKKALRDLNNVETADTLLIVQDTLKSDTDTELLYRLQQPTSPKDVHLRAFSPKRPLPSISETNSTNPTSSSHFPFYTHKKYLERSPYFQQLFQSKQSSTTRLVHLTIPTNAESFYDILRYIYTERVERRHLEPEDVIGTFLNAEFLGLEKLEEACCQEFAMNWENIILEEEFTWKWINGEQLQKLLVAASESFVLVPNGKLRILLQWIRGWPKNRIHEIRVLLADEMNRLSDQIDLAELESLQNAFGAEFDNIIPPSMVMKVMQNVRSKQLGKKTSRSRASSQSSSEHSSRSLVGNARETSVRKNPQYIPASISITKNDGMAMMSSRSRSQESGNSRRTYQK